MPYEQLAGIGRPIHGELHSTDATGIVRVPLTEPSTNAAYTLSLTEFLALSLASLVEVVTGDASLFFDMDDLANAEAITAIADGGAGEDSVTIDGNRAQEFESGRVFDIANSTANDGQYTSTGATYDEDADETTITVATASWTDTTVDGDITSTPLRRSGSTILRGTYAANGGEVNAHILNNLRRGRDGEGVYLETAAAGVVDANIDGVVRQTITKSVNPDNFRTN